MNFIIEKVITLATVIFAGYAFVLCFKKQWLQLVLLIIGISVILNILQDPISFFKMLGDAVIKGVKS